MTTTRPMAPAPHGAADSPAGTDVPASPPGSDDHGDARRQGRLRLRSRFARRAWAGELTPRRYLILASLLLLAGALVQRPGKIVADTKVALTLDPGQFLSGALHLWNPLSDSGSVGNQSTGYLMPMGPFYLLTHALAVPPAVAQRIWLGLLLIVGFWGLVRLADALGLGSRTGRLLGGLAYSLSPFVMSRIGGNSALVLGGVFLPFALLPLVRATFTPVGSIRPALSARRAAALSGVAVLFMSGVNAVVTLDALVGPAIWLLVMCRGRRAWLLRGYWVAAVVCAIAWWFVALRLQGQYGIDFLRYTETAGTTTSVTSLPETLRGTADWLGYFKLGGILLPSAWTYISATAAIVASYVLVGLGLVGLSRRRVPAKRFLLVCLGIGVLGVAAAYPGSVNGVLADQWRHALSGPLGALRNTDKFQPLIRLPLALGLAHCLPLVANWAGARLRRWRVAANAVAALTVLAAVVLGAAPLGLSRIYPDGAFTAVPTYWQDAADWMSQHATTSRTLLAPGSGTGDYTWGDPNDEPLLWLSKTEWAVRNVIPLGGVNSTRLLDAIETQYAQRSAPDLPATLKRAGVGFILVRNDLPKISADQPPSTDEIRTALIYGGMKRVASFGPLVTPRLSGIQLFLKQKVTTGRVPALEIYAAPGAQRVDSYPTSQLAVVSGGPEAIPTLVGAGLLGNRPTVLAADTTPQGDARLPEGVSPSAWIDTDTLDRRDEQFGILHGGGSYLLADGARAAGQTSQPEIRFDLNPTGHQTVARYRGISGVTASAYGTVLGPVVQSGPQAAVDGQPTTAWSVSGFRGGGRGQWLRIALPAAHTFPYVSVQLQNAPKQRPRITALRVTTATGSVVDQVRDTEAAQRIRIPAGSTTFVKLTIEGVRGKGSVFYGPGIREVTLPGIAAARDVVLPNDATAVAAQAKTLSYDFERDRTDPRTFLDFDVERQLSRDFTVPRPAEFFVAATAVTRATTLPVGSVQDGNVDLSCGSGPMVIIDGRSYQTYLHGSSSRFLAGQPIPLGLCSDRPIRLTAGPHRVRTEPSKTGDPLINVASFSLTTQVAAPTQATAPARTSTIIGSWGDERREVKLSGGPSSILTVHENYNRSWHATLNGTTLPAIRVDGWQQGFVVPAGTAVTVVLTNSPGIALRWQLAAAAGLVLLLLVASLWPSRRRPVSQVRPHRRYGPWVSRAGSLLLAAGVIVLVAGPVTTAFLPALAIAVWLLRRFAAVLVVAGVAVAASQVLGEPIRYASSHQGAFGATAQVATAFALAVAILSAGNLPPVRGLTAEPKGPSALGAEEEVVDVSGAEQHVANEPAAAHGLGKPTLVALDVEVGERNPPSSA